MSLYTCEDVSFMYDGKVVLSGLDFQVSRGDYLCVIGENGAGKSTLMKGILHLKKPASGKITTGEGLRTDRIGYLPQQTSIQKDFPASVFEVVLTGRMNRLKAMPFYHKEDKAYAMEQLKLLEIDNLKNRCYRDLSGGQQQRVLLARAICAGSELLVLDEPVSGLDPKMSEELYRLIDKINKEEKRTIIMVSHDIYGIVQYASHILHISKNQNFFGKKEDYMKSEIGMRFLGGAMK